MRTSTTWKAGTAHPRWTAEPSYRAAHGRITRILGSATTHQCADCPKDAQDWSYKESHGFSTDPADYQPRCRKCHRAYDRGE